MLSILGNVLHISVKGTKWKIDSLILEDWYYREDSCFTKPQVMRKLKTSFRIPFMLCVRHANSAGRVTIREVEDVFTVFTSASIIKLDSSFRAFSKSPLLNKIYLFGRGAGSWNNKYEIVEYTTSRRRTPAHFETSGLQ